MRDELKAVCFHSSLIPHPSSLFLTPFHFFYLPAQLLDAREKFVVAHLLAGRRVSLDGESAAGFEHASLDVFEPGKTLTVRDRLQLRLGQKLARQPVATDLSILDERGRRAFDQLIQPPVLEHETHDGVVDTEQRDRADQSTRDAGVVADDRVLHRVREREQDDKIEGIELRQLALAEHTQQHDERDVDDDGAQDFLRDGQARPRRKVRERAFPKST